MLNFKTEKIKEIKHISIIDIGTFKTRVCICEISDEINILGYGEKKQEPNDILHGEIGDIEGVCNTIKEAYTKAYNEAKIDPEEIVINIPTSTVVGEYHKINYKRKHKEENIDIVELDHIIGKVEGFCLKRTIEKIKDTTGLDSLDIKLLTSIITKVIIDGNSVSNPIGFSGENVTIGVLNVFVPLAKYNTIKTIGNFLNKDILAIVPPVYSIPKSVEKTEYSSSDILFIDIGNTRSRVIVMKSGSIEGFKIFDIGIQDLTRLIQEKENKGITTILENIEKNEWITEKEEFLSTWKDALIISLKEIVGNEYIPDKIIVSGGGNYEFIKKYIQENIGNDKEIKNLKPFSFLDKTEITNKIKSDKIDKNNLSLISQILATKDLLEKTRDPIKESLKKFVYNLKI